jgi:hypothetical protein
LRLSSSWQGYQFDVVVNYTLESGDLLMRVKRPRFTVRLLMLAVAVVAIGLWARQMMKLRDNYLAFAGSASAAIQSYDILRDVLIGDPEGHLSEARQKDLEDFDRQSAPDIAHWKFIRDKYLRAARYPWLAVEPDSPGPK